MASSSANHSASGCLKELAGSVGRTHRETHRHMDGEREQERDRDKGTEAKPGSEGVQKGRPEKLQRTRVREEPGH